MPATPANPVALVPPIATAPTTTTTPRRGREGHLTFSQQRLAEPLILEQDTIDPTYNRFRGWTMYIATISVFVIFGTLMFWMGEWRSTSSSGASVPASVAIVQPAMPVVSPPPVQQNTAPQQPRWYSYADCQRHYVLELGLDPEGVCDSFK